eukprot:777-Heterococcus_DN1.PRE.3
MTVLLGSFVMIPYEVTKLVEAFHRMPKHRVGYKFVGKKLHVVIAVSAVSLSYSVHLLEHNSQLYCMHISSRVLSSSGINSTACVQCRCAAGANSGETFDTEALQRMLNELFHEDHGHANQHLWAVVMAPGHPSKAVMNLLNTPRFKLRTMYFRGSVQHPSDLAAVKAEFADCIFLMMPSSYNHHQSAHDQDTGQMAAVERNGRSSSSSSSSCYEQQQYCLSADGLAQQCTVSSCTDSLLLRTVDLTYPMRAHTLLLHCTFRDCSATAPRPMKGGGGSSHDDTALSAEAALLTQQQEQCTLSAMSLQRYLTRAPRSKQLLQAVYCLSATGAPCRSIVVAPDAAARPGLHDCGVDSVLCRDELKLAILAHATVCPAFLVFALCSLRTSATASAGAAAAKASKQFFTTGVASADSSSGAGDLLQLNSVSTGEDSTAAGSSTADNSDKEGDSSGKEQSETRKKKKRSGKSPLWLDSYLEGASFEVRSKPCFSVAAVVGVAVLAAAR